MKIHFQIRNLIIPSCCNILFRKEEKKKQKLKRSQNESVPWLQGFQKREIIENEYEAFHLSLPPMCERLKPQKKGSTPMALMDGVDLSNGGYDMHIYIHTHNDT